MSTPAEPARPIPAWRPWRSVGLARLVTVAALVVGVPPFLRMPPWVDLTLYDVAARNLLSGGVLYRDVFDTNTPGFVWAVAGVRACLGESVEALRAVDLLVVAGVVLLLDRLAARAGASRAARAWAVAGAAAFYPFTSEFNHAQRDVWMLLPAVAAVVLRVRRLAPRRGNDECPTNAPPITKGRQGGARPDSGPSFLRHWWGIGGAFVIEGILWALAVWVKPHVVVPAAAVWLATAPRVVAAGRWRGLAADFLGNLLGGLAVGAAGVGYLVASGAWPAFYEVFTFWNAGYAAAMFAELPRRLPIQLDYFPPWSYLQVVAVPVALLCVLDGLLGRRQAAGGQQQAGEPGAPRRRLPRWLWDPAPTDAARFARLALAALYLGWTAQGLFLQRQFQYVHVPEVLMLLAVLATQRWPGGFAGVAWVAVTSAVVLLGLGEGQNTAGVGPARGPDGLVLHPALDPDRLRQWPGCWRVGLSDVEYRRRMNALALVRGFHAANDWEQLGEVADELRRRGARDGEVVAWHDAPHAVYLLARLRPGFRFLHVSQMAGIGPDQEERLHEELCAAAPHVRWVVSDLLRVPADDPDRLPDPSGVGPDLLPPTLAADVRADFPFDQPAVFRSGGGRGRYVLHEVRRPIRGCGE